MRFRLFSLLCVLLLACAGCGVEPLSECPTNNPAIKVQFLFEHDGCRVYKFKDCGRDVYFVRGGSHAEWTEGGKHPLTHRVSTVEAEP